MKATSLGGNIDSDMLYSHIKTAQDIHLQPIIGTKLLEKLLSIVGDGTWQEPINADYALLLTKYITPVLVYFFAVDFLPFSLYRIQNGGIYKHTSDNAIVAEQSEMNSLVQRFRDKAEFYQRRLNDYLCSNSNLYPEYYSNTNDDMNPDNSGGTYHGWVI